MRIMVHPLSKPHSVQKLLSMLINTCKDCFFILFKLRRLLCQKALCQSDILKCCVLWKKIKLLKHHTKMQPLFAKLRVFILARFGSIKKSLTIYNNLTTVRSLKEVKAP